MDKPLYLNYNNQNKEVMWFKVVPQITKFNGWDRKQGVWGIPAEGPCHE